MNPEAKLSNKALLKQLNALLDSFEMKKSPEIFPVVSQVTGKQHGELRNYRKKMVNLFKDFSYERKIEEIALLAQKLQEKTQNDSNKDSNPIVNDEGRDQDRAVQPGEPESEQL